MNLNSKEAKIEEIFEDDMHGEPKNKNQLSKLIKKQDIPAMKIQSGEN
jgi:hypothetical protein